MGELGGEWAGESEGGEGWTSECGGLSECKRVFGVGFGPGLDSMSPARSLRSTSHDAGLHDWLPPKKLALRRGRIRWIQFA